MTEQQRNTDNAAFERAQQIHHQMPRWVIVLIVSGLAVLLAYRTKVLLGILLISGILAYISNTVISFIEEHGIKRSVAVAGFFAIVIMLLFFANMILGPALQQELGTLYARIPEISSAVERALSSQTTESASEYPMIEQLVRKILQGVVGPGRLFERAFNPSEMLGQAAPFLLAAVLIPFFLLFLLKDWRRLMKTAMGWVPSSYVETTLAMISEVNILVGKYLRGVAIDCLAVGVIATAALWLMGINYPVSLGILSGAANVVPYFGPIFACSASSIIAFVQFGSIGAVLNIVVLYAGIKLFDDLVIQPMTIGKSVKLHPMLLVITIIAGEMLFGVGGMILSVPVVTAAQKVGSILLEHRRKYRRTGIPALLQRKPATAVIRPL